MEMSSMMKLKNEFDINDAQHNIKEAEDQVFLSKYKH